MPINKRESEEYKLVSGYIPEPLAKKFRVWCAAEGVTKNEALERAIELLLENFPHQQRPESD